MLQAGGAAEAPEAVAVLVLRALGMFTHLYNRAPDNLIGSVVAKVLESLRPQSGQPGAPAAPSSARSSVASSSSPPPWPPGAASSAAGCGEPTNAATPRHRICMGVLHKIASACGTKLAVHIDQLSSMIGGIVQHLAPAQRGVMTGMNTHTNPRACARTHTRTHARTRRAGRHDWKAA
jgi:hypothetical protein